MHVLEYLHRNVKTVAMPSAMVVGRLAVPSGDGASKRGRTR